MMQNAIPRFSKCRNRWLSFMAAATLFIAGCAPTVKVATEDPITINLNVNIKHEILVKVDKELDDVFSEESGLF